MQAAGKRGKINEMRLLWTAPSAWLPMLISAAAMALVLGYAALFGVAGNPQPHDEGAPARLFQLLLLAEAAVIGLFALRWLPRAPRAAATILALQMVLAAVPVATILILES